MTKVFNFSKLSIQPWFVFLIAGLVGCVDSENHVASVKDKPLIEVAERTIFIQPLNNVPNEYIELVEGQFLSRFSRVLVLDNINLNNRLMNASHTRYRADSIIRFLRDKTPQNGVTVGLICEDISTTKGAHKDWGVFGLGFRPGNSCVVSSYRLKGDNRLEKFGKVALHEVGHTSGLNHCPVRNCLMRDAEGKDHLDELKAFCDRCKFKLLKTGWRLNP